MRSFAGLFLMLTGIAVGAHAYYPDTIEKHVHLSQLAGILTPAAPHHVVAQEAHEERVRTFSPGGRLVTEGGAERSDAVKTVKLTETPILTSTPKVVRTNGWSAAVVHTASVSETGYRQLSDTERWRLVRDLQTELRRAGCYWGKLDGAWGAGSKNAFQDFMVQVNASLPMTDPEPIMLTLVKAHPGTVCGRTCEDGYTKSANGRCLPYAITAQKSPETDVNLVTPPAQLVRRGPTGAAGDGAGVPAPLVAQAGHSYPDGRMAVGGPIHTGDPRYSAPGVASAPSLVGVAPDPIVVGRPVYRPSADKRRSAAVHKKKRRSASRKRARQKALFRQAFGESFD